VYCGSGFFLVCQAIFNPQNALFVACPNDRRRFYPSPGKLQLAFNSFFFFFFLGGGGGGGFGR
jgi:hypothetical protein